MQWEYLTVIVERSLAQNEFYVRKVDTTAKDLIYREFQNTMFGSMQKAALGLNRWELCGAPLVLNQSSHTGGLIVTKMQYEFKRPIKE